MKKKLSPQDKMCSELKENNTKKLTNLWIKLKSTAYEQKSLRGKNNWLLKEDNLT